MTHKKGSCIVCINPICPFYGTEVGKKIIKRGRNHAGHQQYQCRHCGMMFVETADGLFFKKHIPESSVDIILGQLCLKKTNRAIAKATGHTRQTISGLVGSIVRNAPWVDGYLFQDLKKTRPEMFDFWTTVKKNRRNAGTGEQSLVNEMIGRNRVNATNQVYDK